ncbi:MAG: ComF family protein [Oscillospiraceae bacterium]
MPLTPTLYKQRNTQPQSGTGDAAKRRANITGAYRMKKGADVTGKRVLLIDDIVTTGSTLSEVRACLAKRVRSRSSAPRSRARPTKNSRETATIDS